MGGIIGPFYLQGVGMMDLKSPFCIPEDAMQMGHRFLVDLEGGHRSPGSEQRECKRTRAGADLDDVGILSQRALGGGQRD